MTARTLIRTPRTTSHRVWTYTLDSWRDCPGCGGRPTTLYHYQGRRDRTMQFSAYCPTCRKAYAPNPRTKR